MNPVFKFLVRTLPDENNNIGLVYIVVVRENNDEMQII